MTSTSTRPPTRRNRRLSSIRAAALAEVDHGGTRYPLSTGGRPAASPGGSRRPTPAQVDGSSIRRIRPRGPPMAVSTRRAAIARGAMLACALIALMLTARASAGVPQAHLIGSKAIAPHSAPAAVQAMIDAANHIRHEPYRWGGGHRR